MEKARGPRRTGRNPRVARATRPTGGGAHGAGPPGAGAGGSIRRRLGTTPLRWPKCCFPVVACGPPGRGELGPGAKAAQKCRGGPGAQKETGGHEQGAPEIGTRAPAPPGNGGGTGRGAGGTWTTNPNSTTDPAPVPTTTRRGHDRARNILLSEEGPRLRPNRHTSPRGTRAHRRESRMESNVALLTTHRPGTRVQAGVRGREPLVVPGLSGGGIRGEWAALRLTDSTGSLGTLGTPQTMKTFHDAVLSLSMWRHESE